MGFRSFKPNSEIMEKLIHILRKHGAKKIEIFGSYARGEQKETSDLDVIVEFEKRKSLLELVGIEQELEDNLGIKIDLLTEASISPYLMEKIRKESKVIFILGKLTERVRVDSQVEGVEEVGK